MLAVALVLAALLAGAAPPRATEGYREYQVKAAFLMNFARYTEWPAAAFADEGAPLVIGVLGDDPFGDDLLVLAGKSVGARPLELRRYERVEDVDCHVLYVSRSLTDDLPRVLAALAGRPVFTVSDIDDFASKGGIARFVRAGDHIRFEIDDEAARAAGLKISSHLLRLAMTARRRP